MSTKKERRPVARRFGETANEDATHESFTDTLNRLRQEKRKQRRAITLLRAPLQTFSIFGLVLAQHGLQGVSYIRRHAKTSTAITLLLLGLFLLDQAPGPHTEMMEPAKAVVWNGSWWVLLGVLSSVGLGTGLHTFVLYLGPLVAKATIAATECGSTDFLLYGPDRFICPPRDASFTAEHAGVTFWELLSKVQFEALMWGIGTAIGELPPYFVARAARLSGESLKELDADNDEDEGGGGFLEPIMQRVKPLMYSILGNLGFFGILIFASVPNPLFDLAGITCGHFLVPFLTFFGATLIGKAFIKAHIQTIFVIVMFSKKTLDYVIDLVESLLPWLDGNLRAMIEDEKAKLHKVDGEVTTKEKTLLALLWDIVLVLMLLYFLVSIIESSVQQHIGIRDEDEIQKLKKKHEQT